ncbi:hypothetical protein [Pseudomonas sp. S2_H01]
MRPRSVASEGADHVGAHSLASDGTDYVGAGAVADSRVERWLALDGSNNSKTGVVPADQLDRMNATELAGELCYDCSTR